MAEITSLLEEGDNCFTSGDAFTARTHYEAALKLARDSSNQNQEVTCLIDLGATYRYKALTQRSIEISCC